MPRNIATLYAFVAFALFTTPALAVYDAGDEAKAAEHGKIAKSAAVKEIAKTEPALKAKAADKTLQNGKKAIGTEPSTSTKAETPAHKDAKTEKEPIKSTHERAVEPAAVPQTPATLVTETPPAPAPAAPAPEKKGFWSSLFGGAKKTGTPTTAPAPAPSASTTPASSTTAPEPTKAVEAVEFPKTSNAKATVSKPQPNTPRDVPPTMNIVPQGDPFNLHSAPVKP